MIMKRTGGLVTWHSAAIVLGVGIGIGFATMASAAAPAGTTALEEAGASPISAGGRVANKEAGSQPSASAVAAPIVFARVGDQVITLREYEAAVNQAVSKKYYHAKPPENEVAVLRRKVGDNVVNEVLIFQEALRRGVKPDEEAVQRQIAVYEERYADSAQWQQNRERLLPGLTKVLEKQSQVARMREQIAGSVPEANDEAVKAYYEAHPDKFTEPEKVHLSSILLRVNPSSKKEVWEAARQEAQTIIKRLTTGADFAEIARIQSGDPSAQKGGDMGWLHKGILPPKVQELADTLKPGDVSAPIPVLEGIAIIRLENRRPAVLQSLADVRKRAGELTLLEARDEARRTLVAELRRTTTVQVDESRYVGASVASSP